MISLEIIAIVASNLIAAVSVVVTIKTEIKYIRRDVDDLREKVEELCRR